MQWEAQFTKLVTFKKKHGHCNVPKDSAMGLGNWMKDQRKAWRTKKITPKQVERMQALGVQWDPLEAQWLAKYLELVEFKKKHGHCNVPSKSKSNLGWWLRDQRRHFGNGTLQVDRRKRLETMGVRLLPLL